MSIGCVLWKVNRSPARRAFRCGGGVVHPYRRSAAVTCRFTVSETAAGRTDLRLLDAKSPIPGACGFADTLPEIRVKDGPGKVDENHWACRIGNVEKNR